MFLPRAFAETDLAALDRLLGAHPFVTCISPGAGGELPQVTHLPVLYSRCGDAVLIEGHFARANPQASEARPMLLVVHGPHAYVSPGWYPDKESAARVPTWNYAVAHLAGIPEFFRDEATLADLVARMSQRFEADVGGDWRFESERADQRVQLRGIVGFRLRPADIQMKFKLSQNHPAANVRGVIAGLRGGMQAQGHAVAALMEGALHPSAPPLHETEPPSPR